jgi:hypothetical protein
MSKLWRNLMGDWDHEERRRPIDSGNRLADLATLKANNPQIEDEISAIEAKLSITQPTTEEAGGGTA